MNKATVDSVMAIHDASIEAEADYVLSCGKSSANAARSSRERLRAEVGRLAAQAEPAPAPKKCNRCNGTGLVSDGAIYGSGGVEYENGPVLCVKDCPDCVGPQPAPAPVGEYPALPEPKHRGPSGTGSYFDAYSADQMRAYIDADRAQRPAREVRLLNGGEFEMLAVECFGLSTSAYVKTTLRKFCEVNGLTVKEQS